MLSRLWNLLDVEPEETGPVSLLLLISFLMGLFLASVAVASQSLFLQHFDEKTQLPVALAISGALGMVITIFYNFLQGRIPFTALAIFNLLLVIILTAFIEFGEQYVQDTDYLYYFGFTLILPFTFVTQLVFWGAFNRMFNVRVSKRIIGSVEL